MNVVSTVAHYHPWLHRVAWALVCTVFPLIWVGGLVTTYDAGMAVPDWPGTFGYNMFFYPWQIWLAGPWDLFIEHGHRLLGSLAGLLTITLVVVTWRLDARQALRGLTLALLLLVIGQGVLGGLRVRLQSETLAMLHGCTGPLFFAGCYVAAVATSPTWFKPESFAEGAQRLAALPRSVVFGTLLAYGQLVLGAMLRHPEFDASPRSIQLVLMFHMAVGVALLCQIVVLYRTVRLEAITNAWLRRPATLLLSLAVGQVMLGFATLILKYGWPVWLGADWLPFGFTVQAKSLGASVIITAHVAVGSLILATFAGLTLRVARVAWSQSLRMSTSSASGGRGNAGERGNMVPTSWVGVTS
jgi:cytochrome c oxidase assembly protein subunit 15